MDINDYKNEVARFLKCYDKIVLQQFAPTLLYLPIYLLIKELREECGVNIEIRNSGSNDIETVSCINKSTNAFFNDDASSRELHFGNSSTDDIKRWNLGVQTGTEIKWKNYLIRFRYKYGLTDLANPASASYGPYPSGRYRSFSLDLGYQIISIHK